MLEYKPDKFAMYFNSNKIWQELWGFLNQKESIIRMETASDLNRPALEGVLELLEDRFENIGAQLVKQAAIKTNSIVGDGTTTSILLANSIG